MVMSWYGDKCFELLAYYSMNNSMQGSLLSLKTSMVDIPTVLQLEFILPSMLGTLEYLK
jgi:hypothetical protein